MRFLTHAGHIRNEKCFLGIEVRFNKIARIFKSNDGFRFVRGHAKFPIRGKLLRTTHLGIQAYLDEGDV